MEIPDPDHHRGDHRWRDRQHPRPGHLLLGRFDQRGTLRYTGGTDLNPTPRPELAAIVSPLRALPRRGEMVHPRPQPLPPSWSGQLDRPEPLPYVQVDPTVVVEIDADVAFEHQRWRHRVRYIRARPDMPIYDVPLLVGEEEGYSARHES